MEPITVLEPIPIVEPIPLVDLIPAVEPIPVVDPIPVIPILAHLVVIPSQIPTPAKNGIKTPLVLTLNRPTSPDPQCKGAAMHEDTAEIVKKILQAIS